MAPTLVPLSSDPAVARRQRARLIAEKARRDPVWWAERSFRIEETGEPIKLKPHQAAVLRSAFRRDIAGHFKYGTIVWGQTKKSGKTTIGGLVGRWAAETWGRYQEVLFLGNDASQAKERGFAKMRESIELTPGYDRGKKVLPNRWILKEMEFTNLSNGSKAKAVGTDYKGEAGGNPSITVWTELWGFVHRADLRFWAEMAPSPTRDNSLRFVETYAGYEGESELLWGLYESAVQNGRQLTAGELGDLEAFEEAPNPDSLVPVYVNDALGIFAYWDEGEVAHRMPWQRGEAGARYYAREAGSQTPAMFDRLHLNQWISAESAFIQMEWWDACAKERLPLVPGDQTPMVIALDAAVTGDCFGMVVMSRDPDNLMEGVAVRYAHKWDPPPGGAIDYAGPEEAVRSFCENFNVSQVAYDPYQLHDMATRLGKEGVAWFRPFSQGEERMKADMDLYNLIVHRRIRHGGEAEGFADDLRLHLTNANSKQASDQDTRLRIVKKSENRKIDLAVCLSMAASETLRLNL